MKHSGGVSTPSHHKTYLICGNLTGFRNGVLPHIGVSTFSVLEAGKC